MKNRLPTRPGRALVTPEDGSPPFYATITRADEPTEEGTPLNKATLLTDETAALYGLGEDATVNDALMAAHARIALSEWRIVGNKTFTAEGQVSKVEIDLDDDISRYRELVIAFRWGESGVSGGLSDYSILQPYVRAVNGSTQILTQFGQSTKYKNGFFTTAIMPILKKGNNTIIGTEHGTYRSNSYVYATTKPPSLYLSGEIRVAGVSFDGSGSFTNAEIIVWARG